MAIESPAILSILKAYLWQVPMTRQTASKNRSVFRSSDLLRAIRTSRPFEKSAIQQAVLKAAGRLPPSQSSFSAEYRELLSEMGYSFVHAGFDSGIEYQERELLTFDTNYAAKLSTSAEQEIGPTRQQAFLRMIREILESIGFDRAFFLVLLTDDARAAVERAFPRANPPDYVKWYYLTRNASARPEYPRGCLFFYGRSRFPCLIVSPPDGCKD